MSRARSFKVAFGFLGALAAVFPAAFMWGFSVDDALIPVHYAHHLAGGLGYRFNAAGPSTDGVTPLPWPFLLVPLAADDPMVTLAHAKVLGVVVWGVAGFALGVSAVDVREGDRVSRVHAALVAAGLAVMALAFPLGAWAASGMETGVATALATVAATRIRKPAQAAALAGAASAFRPELVAWALALAFGAVVLSQTSRARCRHRARGVGAAWPLLVAALPFITCVGIRLATFGRPVPLAVYAKPSDLAHGAAYVGASLVVLLLPILAFAPFALARKQGVSRARVLVFSFAVHGAAVLAVGGDWMPYARLMVPVAPSLVLAFADTARVVSWPWSVGRLAIATVLGIGVAVRAAPAGQRVLYDRKALIALARPILADAKVVAALDIGWVSASTDAQIVDLAGLTDPAIALLPGGHTSKRVDAAMLLDRDVDTVVVYSTARVVEARLLGSELFRERFHAAGQLEIGSKGAFYTIYRRHSG